MLFRSFLGKVQLEVVCSLLNEKYCIEAEVKGADSLDIFQIIMGIEEAFDIEIDNEEAEKIVTVGDAVEQIKNAIN